MATNNSINTPVIDVTNHGIMVGQGTAATTTKVLTTGQILVGVTGSDPVATALGTQTWVDQTAASVTMVAYTKYVADRATAITFTIPAVAAVGDTFAVQGLNTGLSIIQMNAGQTCNFGSSPTTVAGTLTATNRYDAIKIVCLVANTTFGVESAVGNWTVA